MATTFNFNSQICTTREQSERLLALGLKKETADCAIYLNGDNEFIQCSDYWGWKEQANMFPAWSLHRLMEMVDPWEYKNWIGEDIENDYDNMIQCISFLIDDRRFNKEYLVDKEAIEEHCKGVMEYLDYIRGEEE